VLDLINNPANDTHVLENARSLVEGQPTNGLGSRFTSMLFGGKLSAITDAIGSVSGLRGGTAASLMSLGAPLLLGSLVQGVRQGSMDPSRLTSFLSEEAAGVQGARYPREFGISLARKLRRSRQSPRLLFERNRAHGFGL
jgi:Bacterial protein of unknown function (DUF937)